MKVACRTLLSVAVATVWIGAAIALMAQDKSTTQVTPGETTVTTQVDRAEVVYVSGNDLVVRMENGEVRHLVVADTVTANVDGKQLTVHDLKPGMKLQRTITTTSTARTVTTARTISGRIFSISAPNSLILSTPDGNKQYRIPKDQVFMVDGQKRTAFDLRPGMNITATVVTETPEVVTSEAKTVTGTAPAPPPKPATPPPQSVLLIEVVPVPVPVAAARPAPAPVSPTPPAQEPAPTKLPKTASVVPLLGMLGLLCFVASLVLRNAR